MTFSEFSRSEETINASSVQSEPDEEDEEGTKRMQCDHKPMDWRKRLDLDAYLPRFTKAMEPARLRVSPVERFDSAERSYWDHTAS